MTILSLIKIKSLNKVRKHFIKAHAHYLQTLGKSLLRRIQQKSIKSFLSDKKPWCLGQAGVLSLKRKKAGLRLLREMLYSTIHLKYNISHK